MSLLSYKGKIMQKALELFEQIEDFDENPYHQTRTIIFNREDMAFIKEAKLELVKQQARNCLSCKKCNKSYQLLSDPPQYELTCGIFKTVTINNFKQICSEYE